MYPKKVKGNSYPTPMLSKRSIVKSNQINEAVFKLSSTEYILILLLISQIQENDTENGLKYQFNTKYISQVLGMVNNKDAYARIRDAVTALHTKTVIIHCDNVVIQHNWLISSYYTHENGNFVLELNPNLKPYLLNLKGHFTKYRLNNVLSLPTIMSIRLYELLKQYVTIGKREFKSQQLRLQLGLNATDYAKSYDFKTRILIPAVKEINTKTDIQVELHELKDGRAIGGYKFMIKPNDEVKSLPKKAETRLLSPRLVLQLQQIGFSSRQLQFLSERYTEKFLWTHLDYALERHKVTPYANLRAYLTQRFREKSGIAKQTFEKAKENIREELTQVVADNLAREALAPNEGVIQLAVEDLPLAEQATLQLLNTPMNETEPIQMIMPNYTSAVPPKPVPLVTETFGYRESFEQHEDANGGGLPPKAKKPTALTTEAYKALCAFGVTKAQLKHLTFSYDEQRIMDNLAYTQARHLKKPLDAPVYYFLRAVEENYHEAQQADLKGAKGLLRGTVVSHLPNIPNPVEPMLEFPALEQLPTTQPTNTDCELNENELYVIPKDLDRETTSYLLQYRIEVGFMQSIEDLEQLMMEYIPKIERSISNGVSLDTISSMESELVEFYLSLKH